MDEESVLQLTKDTLLCDNLYAYSFNNPVMYCDPSGHLPTISIGSTNKDQVRILQNYLSYYGITDDYNRKLVVDGIFGRNTLAAVKKFQRICGLVPTGIVNQQTWDLFNRSGGSNSNGQTPTPTPTTPKPTSPPSNSSDNSQDKFLPPDKNATAAQRRQQIVDLAKACIGHGTYKNPYADRIKLLDGNYQVKNNLLLDCSAYTSSVYYTLGYDVNRSSNQAAKQGKDITDFKNIDMTINYNNLLCGDLLFFDYNCVNNGSYDHVAIYIGGGQYIDVASRGCSINTSASYPSSSSYIATLTINQLHWDKPKSADVHDMIVKVVRIIP